MLDLGRTKLARVEEVGFLGWGKKRRFNSLPARALGRGSSRVYGTWVGVLRKPSFLNLGRIF